MKTLEKSVQDAIRSIKRGAYKGTFIKGELEADLGRDTEESYYDEYEDCDTCIGRGEIECECEQIPVPEGEHCSMCQDQGSFQCQDCDGEGRVEVERDDTYWSDEDCLDFIMQNVSTDCRDATVFSDFVVDGSVDSEFNFTIPIDHPEYFVEYIEAFKKLSREIGNGLDVSNAGMHIAILRSEDGGYPHGNGRIDHPHFENFSKAMERLMPALLFLASEDRKSRGLSYRNLGVGRGTHANAVDIADHGDSGVLEWRVFETCYRRPEMFYDYLCTIAKGLAFYSAKPKKLDLPKIGMLEFYDNGSAGLAPYFYTEKHLKALNAGLAYLRPDHRSKKELFRLREFGITPSALKLREKRLTAQVEGEWIEYRKKRTDDEKRWVESNIRQDVDHYLMVHDRRPSQAWLKRKESAYKEAYAKNNPQTKRAFLNKRVKECVVGTRSPMCRITI